MTQSEISLFEAIDTQRAIRHFAAQPVSDESISTILQSAVHAPNGGNRQPWHFLVVRDRESKRRLGQWYLKAWEAAVTGDMRTEQPYRSGGDLGENMPDTPVVILVCQRTDSAPTGSFDFPRRSEPVARGAGPWPGHCGLPLCTRLTRVKSRSISGYRKTSRQWQ